MSRTVTVRDIDTAVRLLWSLSDAWSRAATPHQHHAQQHHPPTRHAAPPGVGSCQEELELTGSPCAPINVAPPGKGPPGSRTSPRWILFLGFESAGRPTSSLDSYRGGRLPPWAGLPSVGQVHFRGARTLGAHDENEDKEKPSNPVSLLSSSGWRRRESNPQPGGAKLSAESRPYLVTTRNDLESLSRRVPCRVVLSHPIPQAPATYVQHGGGRTLTPYTHGAPRRSLPGKTCWNPLRRALGSVKWTVFSTAALQPRWVKHS